MDIAFVILHYNSIEDTRKCVDSIIGRIDTQDYAIIIVDNASPNGTGAILEKEYSGRKHMVVLLSKENIGFARGNNIGIDYARGTLHADYICCLNSDIVFLERHFFHKISSAYSRHPYTCLGPRIIDRKGRIVSKGFPKDTLSLRKLTDYVASMAPVSQVPPINHSSIHRALRAIVPLRALVIWARSIRRDLCLMLRAIRARYCTMRGVLLHGCCIVFAPLFFEHYKGFCDKTFMFFEEELLYAHLVKAGLSDSTLYLPSILVQHMEEGATTSTFTDSEAKRAFRYKYCKQSLDILREYIEENNIPTDK